MKKTLILVLALVLALPILVRAQDSQPGNRPEKFRQEGRALGRPIPPGLPSMARQNLEERADRPNATGTEAWRLKTREYLNQIKTERELRRQNASSTAINTERREQKREEKDERKLESRNERVKLYADYLLQRLERQIDNVSNLISRVKNRTKIMADNGKDITAINIKISLADTALNGAKDQIKLLPGRFETLASTTGTSSKPILEAQKIGQTIVEAIKQAHSLIVEAITMINQGKNN